MSTIDRMVSGATVLADKRTVRITRLNGSVKDFVFTEQLDMNTITVSNGIFYTDTIDTSTDGLYIDGQDVASVVKDGEVIQMSYTNSNNVELSSSLNVSVVNGREVYSSTSNFTTSILGGSSKPLKYYIGFVSQIFTSPTSISIQTSLETLNFFQDDIFSSVDANFIGKRYYSNAKSSFYLGKNNYIVHDNDNKLYAVNTANSTKVSISNSTIDCYSIIGSIIAISDGGEVSIHRITGRGNLLSKFPIAKISLGYIPNRIALSDDLFIVTSVNNSNAISLHNLSGVVIASRTLFDKPEAIAIDKNFNFIYASNGRVKMIDLYDNYKVITSFGAVSDKRCPLEYAINAVYNKKPDYTLDIGLTGNVDGTMTVGMELVSIINSRLTKHTFVQNNPEMGIESVLTGATTLTGTGLSVVSLGSLLYVSSVENKKTIVAYILDTLSRDVSRDIVLNGVFTAEYILSMSRNTDGTYSILDSDYKVTIIDNLFSQNVILSYNAVSNLSIDSKIVSVDGRDVIASYVSAKGTNMHLIDSITGNPDPVTFLEGDEHAVPMVAGMRLCTLSSAGNLREYKQSIDIRVL